MNENELEQKCQILMQDIKKDIDSLEFQVKHVKLENLKRNAIKKLKISARCLQFVSPYVLLAGVSLAGFSAVSGNVPFYRDIVPYYEHTRTELDDLGNVSYQKQYGSFDDETNILNYTSKWKEREDGLFERSLQTYTIPYLDYDEVIGLLEDKSLSAGDVLVNIYSLSNSNEEFKTGSSIKEIRNHLDSSEVQNPSSIQVVLYNEDKDNYIMREESSATDSIYQLTYSVLTILLELFVANKTNGFNMDLYGWIKELNDRYQPVDEDRLKKELKIKLDNYARLGGDSNEFSR